MKDAVRRNPVLGLKAMAKLMKRPAAERADLAEVLRELGQEAQEKAEASWKRHKAPMAAYWKAVAVWARHIARALR